MSAVLYKDDDSSRKANDDNWRNMKVSVADIAKLKKLNDISKLLFAFGNKVRSPTTTIADLRSELVSIRRINPELLDATDQILISRRILTDQDRDLIVRDVVDARVEVSRGIVEEGAKCSIPIIISQYANLWDAWQEIQDAKVISQESKQELPAIERMIELTKAMCIEAQAMMREYERQASGQLLNQLVGKTKLIRENYQTCLKKIQKLKFDQDESLYRLKFSTITQTEAKVLNVQRAGKNVAKCSFNPLNIFNIVTYGLASCGNYVVGIKSDKRDEKLGQFAERLSELEKLLSEVEKLIKEAETFLKEQQVY